MNLPNTSPVDLHSQVLNGSLVCDAFYATADCLAELSNHADLKRLLGNHIPNKRFNLVSEARELHDPIHETIIHNHVNLKQCNVIIGVVCVWKLICFASSPALIIPTLSFCKLIPLSNLQQHHFKNCKCSCDF